MLDREFTPWLAGFAAWTAALVGTYAVYLLYNRVDKSSRIWLYGLLQLARAGSFLVVVPVTSFGAMALAAHALSRWFLYFLYRINKRDWPLEVPHNVVRLFTFVLLAAPLALGVPPPVDQAAVLTAVIVFAWFTLRAGPRLFQLFKNVHFITSPKSDGPALPRCASDDLTKTDQDASRSTRH